MAGRTPPAAESFESLDQAENGIGLVAAFRESFEGHRDMDPLGTGFFQSVDGAPALGYRAPRQLGLERTPAPEVTGDVVVLTGEYAAPIIRELLDEHGFGAVDVVAVQNRYFGGNIKVAGLLTGADLARTLDELAPRGTCLLPDVCLSEGRFLDGLSLEDLPRPVTVVPTTGQDLRHAVRDALAKGLVHS